MRPSMSHWILLAIRTASTVMPVSTPNAATPILIRRIQRARSSGEPLDGCSASTPKAAKTAKPALNRSVAAAGTRAFSTKGTTA